MDANEFRLHGKQLIDFIADYLETQQETREVLPRIEPGYLSRHVPETAPEEPQAWEDVLKDVDEHILKGTTHWLHPNFHAYFPIGISYASILGDLLSSCFGVGFTWRSNPAVTELERLVLDWLVDLAGMPQHFRNDSGLGGGALQGSASDCVLVSMLAARKAKLAQLDKPNDASQLPRLVAYCSQLAHSCVAKAAEISCIRLRKLPYDGKKFALRCEELKRAVLEDKQLGLVPFYVCAVLGTTACASCDNLEDIGKICQREGLWCHVDAAYAGSAFICQEFRHFLKGIELVDSFNFNASKWLLCTFDASILWVKDKEKLTASMTATPSNAGNAAQDQRHDNICDLKDWGIPLSRRFRALKLWFVMRLYGAKKLRAHIRRHCQLAQKFQAELMKDERFQIFAQTHFSLVCFRFRNNDTLSQLLVCRINQSRELHLMPATVSERYVIRFAIVRECATEADVSRAVARIRQHADRVDRMTDDDVINTNLAELEELENDQGTEQAEANYTTDDLIVGLSELQLNQKWRRMLQKICTERAQLADRDEEGGSAG